MSTVKILSILEAASIETRQARAIAECLELAVEECRSRATTPAPAPLPSPSKKQIPSGFWTSLSESKPKILLGIMILWIAQVILILATDKLF